MAPVTVKYISENERELWDDYVSGHPQGNVYQLFFWGDAINCVYGHKIYYLMAVDSSQRTVGILPLAHIKHILFGNKLFSMPFSDMGGVLADSSEIGRMLIDEAVSIADRQGISSVELRQADALDEADYANYGPCLYSNADVNKVRMLLPLPGTADELMASFKAKLRSQIRRPLKDGLLVKSGGIELLDDFYAVFAENMRDLASPVHSKLFIKNVVECSSDRARLFVVYKDEQPLACSLTLVGKDVLANPWASSLRQYSRMSPNMLLYWAMLEYGCEEGLNFFDFGRSTPQEGTFKFKKQWGTIEKPLNWMTYSTEDITSQPLDQKSKFGMAMELWKRLPVPVTKIIGPAVRKNIGL